MKNERVLVTGGAGFIGSHLVENLLDRGHDILIIDNFSSGKRENLAHIKDRVNIVEGDLRNLNFALHNIKDVDLVFHLAANCSVDLSSKEPFFDFESNALTTMNVLEAMRKNDILTMVFTSSSTVYGELDKFPIPESAELRPISNYGASKVSAESYIRSFSSLYGMNGLVLRYANIMGPKSTHAVVPDFVRKLGKNDKKLLILGNGKQKKSYLFISDCINASLLALEHFEKGFDVFNIGAEECIIVDDIARIVYDELGLRNVKLEYTGGERGWMGDVKEFLLDVRKIKNLGWKPKYSTEQSIRKTVDWLKNSSHAGKLLEFVGEINVDANLHSVRTDTRNIVGERVFTEATKKETS